MNIETVRGYFNDPKTVDHYMKAVANVGLWESEVAVFSEYLEKSNRILDLGCGAGRIALGLCQEGYRNVMGADVADEMVARAEAVAEFLECDIVFQREDATRMSFEGGCFDAVIFGFNGLMQIPGEEARLAALQEICRVLKPGGRLIFTTLDREAPLYKEVFQNRSDPEHCIESNEGVLEFGDRHFDHEHGTTFMHVPLRSEVESALERAKMELVASLMRSEICSESSEVEAFSEDCRFWVAKKPA